MQQQHFRQRGFTLVEMGIGLVVVGLVIGALVLSQALLRSSRVQSIITDVNQYKAAIHAFGMEYEYLPGDLPEANHYWPNILEGFTKLVASGGGTESSEDANGNGDGRINDMEVLYAWLMLDVSGVAPGLSTKIHGFAVGALDNIKDGVNEIFGVPSAYACFAVAPGSNIPPTSIKGGGYFLAHAHDPLYDRSDNAITVGKFIEEDTSLSRMRGPLLTPAEAYRIDLKLDNGTANTGDIVSANGTGVTGCVSAGQYLSGDAVPSCFMAFWLAKP